MEATSLAINAYDEYGIQKPGNSGRFQYTGQTWLAEVGLYYYKARLYNPTLGRFMQPDPIGYKDGMNWYAYVGNDPINGSDPSGTTCAKETGPTGETEERCVADHGRDEWTEDQVDEFDKDYTQAVAKVDAAAKDGKTYTLEVDGEQMEIDAKALAKRLREMVVTLTKNTPPPDGKTPVWRVLGQAFDGNKVTFYGAARDLGKNAMMEIIVHEGLHKAGGYDEFTKRVGSMGDHDGAYDSAASRLLGLGWLHFVLPF